MHSRSRERRSIHGSRHYFGWYAWNVLDLDARDIALHFGHQDGGELVRKTYGHPDAALARERVREAFRQAPATPRPLVAASGNPRRECHDGCHKPRICGEEFLSFAYAIGAREGPE